MDIRLKAVQLTSNLANLLNFEERQSSDINEKIVLARRALGWTAGDLSEKLVSLTDDACSENIKLKDENVKLTGELKKITEELKKATAPKEDY